MSHCVIITPILPYVYQSALIPSTKLFMHSWKLWKELTLWRVLHHSLWSPPSPAGCAFNVDVGSPNPCSAGNMFGDWIIRDSKNVTVLIYKLQSFSTKVYLIT